MVQPIGIIDLFKKLDENGAPGMAMVPTAGPKQTPVSNDNNSLAGVALCCLGHFWWPLWWTQVGSHVR